MSSDTRDRQNVSGEIETYPRVIELAAGDNIELIYEDSPQTTVRARVNRILTDNDESMGPEVEDYVACWFEIEVIKVEGEDAARHQRTDAWTCAVALCTDFKYTLDGRRVTVRKS